MRFQIITYNIHKGIGGVDRHYRPERIVETLSHYEPDIVLIGTGSEVQFVMEAKEVLADEGISAQVVSMPSWELFDAQPDEYRHLVLPPDVPRLAVETGATLAWGRYADETIGIDHYGASAPYQRLYKEFGFTVENIVAKAKALLGS